MKIKVILYVSAMVLTVLYALSVVIPIVVSALHDPFPHHAAVEDDIREQMLLHMFVRVQDTSNDPHPYPYQITINGADPGTNFLARFAHLNLPIARGSSPAKTTDSICFNVGKIDWVGKKRVAAHAELSFKDTLRTTWDFIFEYRGSTWYVRGLRESP